VALMLAVGAGLLARSFVALVRVDPGFRADSAITMTLSPPESPEGAARGAEVARFERPLLDRIGRIPGVTAVGSTSSLPLAGGGSNGTFQLEADRSRAGDAEFRCVTEGYFAAMGIPLLTGRGFESGDGPDAPHVAVVSRTFAERYFPNEDPVGRRILFGNMDGDDRPLEVVGIAGDVRERGLDREVRPVVYANALQRPRSWVQTYVVRTEGDSNAAAAAMRTALRDLQPDGAATFETLERVVASSVDDRRFALVVVAVFAVVALALAAAGVYGVMSYTVAQRTREIGIQMALGARRGQVLGLVLGRGIRLAGVGVLVGLAGSLAATRALSGLLFGVTATDPLTLVGVAALLIATAIAACLGPARRATRVDPLVALKTE
jgi:predicted permease